MARALVTGGAGFIGSHVAERFLAAGYEVVVLDEGTKKKVSGADVREALRSGGVWETLVPPGVAAVISGLARAPV